MRRASKIDTNHRAIVDALEARGRLVRSTASLGDGLVRSCAVDGCGRPHDSFGYCGRHAQQVRRHGRITDADLVSSKECARRGHAARWGDKSTQERISEKTTFEPNTGCWLWMGSVDHHGYAQIRVAGKLWYVTRWLLGLSDPRVLACHHCDNGPIGCVNPAHLYSGDPRSNTADMWRRGRQGGQWRRKTHCPRGHKYKRYADDSAKCLECERQWARERARRLLLAREDAVKEVT